MRLKSSWNGVKQKVLEYETKNRTYKILKNDKLDFIRMKNICSVKDTIKRIIKTRERLRENITKSQI